LSNNVKETISSLLFADRAKKIKNKATLNVVKEENSEQLLQNNKLLTEEVQRLKIELSKHQEGIM